MVLWNLDLIEHMSRDGSPEILEREDNVDVSRIRLEPRPRASKLVASQIIIDEVPVTGSEKVPVCLLSVA